MTSTYPDIDLVLLNKRADSAAFAEAILGKYYDYIYRLCLSIVDDPADAADASQETFINAIADIDRYSVGTNFRAWLSRIAVFKCYAILRKRKIRKRLQSALRIIHSNTLNSPGPLDFVSKNEKVNELRSAIRELSSKHRVVIVLRYIHGLSIREMSEVLELREGTVHSRLHYAIRNLRKMIDK
jgi:RNA polymerase sigma-70 factor (ECF subfamily)